MPRNTNIDYHIRWMKDDRRKVTLSAIVCSGYYGDVEVPDGRSTTTINVYIRDRVLWNGETTLLHSPLDIDKVKADLKGRAKQLSNLELIPECQ